MKNIFAKIAVVALAASALCSCAKEGVPAGADTANLRVAVTPAPGTISAAGGSFEATVTVAQGTVPTVDWEASVDFAPDWITVEKIQRESVFTGTYAGDDRTLTVEGIKVTVKANATGAKRNAFIRFTVPDGGSVPYTIAQDK